MPSSPPEIVDIRTRNQRVERDKAWETSKTRTVAIMVMTYIVATIFLWMIRVDRPWLNALMPVIGFGLSTLSLPVLKQYWIKRHYSSSEDA